MQDLGYDGGMLDLGELIPPDAMLADGTRGLQSHNRYPLLYARSAWQLASDTRPDGDFAHPAEVAVDLPEEERSILPRARGHEQALDAARGGGDPAFRPRACGGPSLEVCDDAGFVARRLHDPRRHGSQQDQQPQDEHQGDAAAVEWSHEPAPSGSTTRSGRSAGPESVQ